MLLSRSNNHDIFGIIILNMITDHYIMISNTRITSREVLYYHYNYNSDYPYNTTKLYHVHRSWDRCRSYIKRSYKFYHMISGTLQARFLERYAVVQDGKGDPEITHLIIFVSQYKASISIYGIVYNM